ncbi:toll/interleukin-1 receptor domain-containing protein [Clostridium perfringens]|uniref:toll/interleukin-1 receptor domain-containing protein n=1 Tax=Clostridium perfringens TaxID=1502 RepID=UPI0018E41588|nr:toll/interleukin-1 receptor domain-containing protein [Clostridium perfringens]MBI6039882.1 toll/interleukin-1 receptor domain-containing protein [Clostridium perfringens]
MIFISHTYKDKEIVEPIANRIATVFGRDNVFYDSWSIQPGDGIIDRMNTGLQNCKYFFFFVSKNSLESNMVRLEWQNAIYKATNQKAKLIPVKLDDCLMPAILMQTLYIDIYNLGLENAVRQMIDVINGNNTFNNMNTTYNNLRAYIKNDSNKIIDIEFRAESYLEPISRFLILVKNLENELVYNSPSDSMINSSFNNDLILNTGLKVNGIYMATNRGTSPNFPFRVKLSAKDGYTINLVDLMKATDDKGSFTSIPIIYI